jgi:arylsulfatase A
VVQPADAPTRIVRGIPEFENPPLRAGKGSCYEGGIRVPMLVRWPGVVPAGKVCDTPVHGVDLLPTMLPMAGAKVPSTHKVDGVNLLPVLRTGSSKGSRALYGYMPFYDVRWAHTPSAILREGDFKLIEFFGDYLDANRGGEYVVGERLELYNLRDDVSEQQNLASANPQRVKQMRAKLHAWIRSCGEQLPALNPNFDPKRALAESRLA